MPSPSVSRGLGVGDRDRRPVGDEEPRDARCRPALPEPDDGDPSPREVLRPDDRPYQNKAGGAMKSPPVRLLAILENGFEILPLVETLGEHRLVQADHLRVPFERSRV